MSAAEGLEPFAILLRTQRFAAELSASADTMLLFVLKLRTSDTNYK